MELDTSGIKNELICIEYPGVVKNVDNMFKTLGGLSEVSKVMRIKNRRLELRFRPDDLYCKPVCGDKVKSNRLLLRIKVTIVKNKATGETNALGCVHIVGRVTTSIKFKSLCDFQYLPLDMTPDGKVLDLSKDLVPLEVNGDKIEKWIDIPIANHFPPPAFARVDNLATNSYMYRATPNEDEKECKVIGRTRKRRSGHAVFVSFDVKAVPAKPKEKAMKFLQIKMLDKQYAYVKKMFDERPVWSKLALMCVTNLTHDTLKYVLPATAYYFVTGPFRVMWVRFGYDPRHNAESKVYQTLDYRMRSLAGLTSKIKAKRNYTNYVLPNKSSYSSKPKAANVTLSQKELEITVNAESRIPKLKGDEYIFTPSTIPHTRQMFYQYIDLKVPEIDSLFARLPKDGKDAVCDPRMGFLPRGFDVHCRNLITDYVSRNLKKNEEESKLEGIGGGDSSVEEEVEESGEDDEEDEVADSWQVENIEEDEIDSSENDD